MYSYTATGRGHLGPKIQNFREKNCIAWAYFGGFSPPAYTEFIIIFPFFLFLSYSSFVFPFRFSFFFPCKGLGDYCMLPVSQRLGIALALRFML